jgi:Bacterial Ig-like domain
MIKKAKLIFTMVLAAGLASMYLEGCKKDDDPSALSIVSITSTGTNLTTGSSETVDLNGATSPTNVPTNGALTVTFSKPVNGATVTSTSVTLSDGTTNVPLTIVTTGAAVKITPTSELVRGTLHTISVTSAVLATDGGKFTTASRTFTTAGKKPPVVPQSSKLVVYVPFEGVVVDKQGHTVLNSAVTFAADRFGNFNGSADFNGTTNYVGIQYAADMSNANTTVSYWIKLPASQAYKDHVGLTSGDTRQYVTFAIGGNNGTFHQWSRFTCCGLGFDIDVLRYYSNHKNSGSAGPLAGSEIDMKNEGKPAGDRIVEVNNITWLEANTGKWMHIVTSWNAATRTKSFYVNGVPSTVYKLTPST